LRFAQLLAEAEDDLPSDEEVERAIAEAEAREK
jgi:hypothetical protein